MRKEAKKPTAIVVVVGKFSAQFGTKFDPPRTVPDTTEVGDRNEIYRAVTENRRVDVEVVVDDPRLTHNAE